MATRKRSRRPSGPAVRVTPGAAKTSTRRERKEEVRRAREAEARRSARNASLRRALAFLLAGAVALGILWFVQRAPAVRPIPADVVSAAAAAGCSVPARQFDAPSRAHLSPGENPGYTQHPTTAGPHNPTPLPDDPRVYLAPVDETAAVHSLEHAAVIVYYRAAGDGGIRQPVVDDLARLVPTLPFTYLIPYPDLPAGEGLALAAWNQLQTCPTSIRPAQADTVVRGFVTAFACTRNAPEPRAGAC